MYPQQAELSPTVRCTRPASRPTPATLPETTQLPDPHHAVSFPEPGDWLGEARLIARLGEGSEGQIFLAVQPSLADRPVVLKVTPAVGAEHLSLARLQHTHIMPLYGVQEFPGRGLRALCFPFLGGASLAKVLEQLRDLPPAQRTGKDIVTALEAAAPATIAVPNVGPIRDRLIRDSYVQAVCRIGVSLAEALEHAHRRGLLHLDVKPANVLLAADGQPMLLDFHLAQSPLHRGQTPPAQLGGTTGYAAPEQEQAWAAVAQGLPIPEAVGEPADIFGLGCLLYEALAGCRPEAAAAPLQRVNPQVSTGLAQVIGRCLAADPAERYASAAALAEDLRRHLADQPLRFVPNNPIERLRKWRRRRPLALPLVVLALFSIGDRAAELRPLFSEPIVPEATALARPIEVKGEPVAPVPFIVDSVVPAVAEEQGDEAVIVIQASTAVPAADRP